MGLLESRPPGGAIQPGFLSYQVGYSSTWVPRRSCIPTSLVQSVKSTTFSGPIKIEEEKAKTREPFLQYQRNQTTKKNLIVNISLIHNFNLSALSHGWKKWIKNSSHLCFKWKVRFFPELGGFDGASLSQSFLIFAVLLALWATEKRPFHFPLLFLANSFSFDHGFCCCCVGQRRCCAGVCVCVFACLLLFLSSWSPKKKIKKQQKNDGNMCRFQIPAAGWGLKSNQSELFEVVAWMRWS